MRYLLMSFLLLAACAPRQGSQGAPGRPGTPGQPGPVGAPGSSCSVVSETYGALIVCSDGTSIEIHNGADGIDGQDCTLTSHGHNGHHGKHHDK